MRRTPMSVRYSVALAAFAALSVLLPGGFVAEAGAQNYSRYHVRQAAEDGEVEALVIKRRRPKQAPQDQQADGPERRKPAASSPPAKSTELKKKQNLKSIFELIKEEAKASRRKPELTAQEIDTYETPPQSRRKKQKASKQANKGVFKLMQEEARKSTAGSSTVRPGQIASEDEESDKKRKKAKSASDSVDQKKVVKTEPAPADAQQKAVKRKKKPAAPAEVAVSKV